MVGKKRQYDYMINRGKVNVGKIYKKAKPYVVAAVTGYSARSASNRGQGFTNSNTHTNVMVNANDLNASLYQRKNKGKPSKRVILKKNRRKGLSKKLSLL